MKQRRRRTLLIDECLGTKIVPPALREDGALVRLVVEEWGSGTLDRDYLHHAGRKGWLLLTCDRRMAWNPLELLAICNGSTRVFSLVSESMDGPAMANALVRSWRKMEGMSRAHRGPFIANVYKTGIVRMWKDHKALHRWLRTELPPDE